MKEVPMVPSTSEQPQAISQSPIVTLQIPSVVKPILSNHTSGSISSMSDPDLQKMQERVTALKTGQPAINVSESGAQGNVIFSAVEKYYTPTNATLPYPGLDGHPRRIVPTPVSVNMLQTPAVTVKSPDQIRQETAEMIERDRKSVV